MSLNRNSIAVLNIHGVDYRCIIAKITKSEAINLLRNADFSKKRIIIEYKKICYV